ncbi:MAG: hypothetical protein ACK5MT_14095 [Actinomycetales bacterium]
MDSPVGALGPPGAAIADVGATVLALSGQVGGLADQVRQVAARVAGSAGATEWRSSAGDLMRERAHDQVDRICRAAADLDELATSLREHGYRAEARAAEAVALVSSATQVLGAGLS